MFGVIDLVSSFMSSYSTVSLDVTVLHDTGLVPLASPTAEKYTKLILVNTSSQKHEAKM